MTKGLGDLKKVRTFRDDVEQARQGKSVPAPTSIPTQPKETVSAQEPSASSVPTPEKKPVTPLPPPPHLPKHNDQDKVKTKPITAATDTQIEKTESTNDLTPDTATTPATKLDSLQTETAKLVPEESLDMMASDDSLMEGSIVTDKKRDRFHLLPAIGEAVTGWWQKEKQELEDYTEKKRAAVPKVRPIEERKKIIERAAEGSVLATKRESLQIKQRPAKKKGQNKTPVAIKKKSETPKPSWSHYTGDQKQSEELSVAPTPKPTTKPATSETTSTKTEKTPTGLFGLPEISMTAPTLSDAPIKTASPAKEKPTVQPVAKAAPAPNPKPATPSKPKQANSFGRVFSWWRIGAMVAGAIVLGIGLTFGVTLWLNNTDNNQPITVTELPNQPTNASVANNQNQKNVTLGGARLEFLNLLSDTRTTEAKLTTVNLLTNTGTTASKSQVLSLLNLNAANAFIQNINEITFAWWLGEPVVLLRVGSFDNAFGGILEWEKNMSYDLAPLFGDVVTSISTSPAEDSSPTKQPYFVDELVNNIDVRVLRDEMQTERITYGFKDHNLIIITTTKDAFGAVVELVH